MCHSSIVSSSFWSLKLNISLIMCVSVFAREEDADSNSAYILFDYFYYRETRVERVSIWYYIELRNEDQA